MRKKLLITLVFVLVLAIAGAVILAACGKEEEKPTPEEDTTSIMLQDSGDSIVIGVSGKQEWKFQKEGSGWIFDGVYVNGVRTFEVADGGIFRFSKLSYNTLNPDTVIPTAISSIKVVKNDDDTKILEVANNVVKMYLTVNKDNEFVKRDITIDITCDNEIADFQLNFALRSVDGMFDRKDGAIATKNNSITSAELPYAYPALYSQFYAEGKTVDLINIVEYNSTSFAVNNMRLRKVQDVFESGPCSGTAIVAKNDVIQLHDYWYIAGQTNNDMYDLIGMMTKQASICSPMALENLASQGNINVETFEELSAGLYQDLSDARAKINGAFVPYGYNEGWSESFASFDVLKGLVRYARQIGDNQMYIDATNMVKFLIGDNGWVTRYNGPNAKADEYFLYQSFDGKYSANSSGEESGTRAGISTWKYYDMIANLAELALYTEDQQIIDGFLRLMPFFNRLVLDNYHQPVAWYYDDLKPVTGQEDGGSGGAAAIWGYVHLIASDLTKDATQKAEWKKDGLASLEHANALGFFKMHSIRVAVKSVSIGWAVRGNVYAYNMTGDSKYLDSAKHIAQGMMSFYYVNNNPYTFFTSYGYAYACTRERWEAYFETANALWLMVDIMGDLSTSTEILDMFYASSKSHVWFFPVNATPYGNYTGPLDSIDGHYIPFEFGTGVLGDDPGNEGGIQALLRQTKEIYGCGETFLEYLMFEAFARSVDSRILTLCLTSSLNSYSNTNNSFVFYNPFEQNVSTAIMFPNFAQGNYKVTVDGVEKGVYSSTQLENGIGFDLSARTSYKVSVQKVGDQSAAQQNEKIAVTGKNISNAKVDLTATAGYNHYIWQVSMYDDFVDYDTYYTDSADLTLWFDDNSTLYVRAMGVDTQGVATVASDIYTVLGNDADVDAVDNFSEGVQLKGWKVVNGDARGDFYTGQFFSSSDMRETTLVASKTYSVDASTKLFEIRFVTKNANSLLNVRLVCGDKTVSVFEGIKVLEEGVLQYDLTDLFAGKSGKQDVKVVIESVGKSRGFAVDYIRFFNLKANSSKVPFLNNVFQNQFCTSTVKGSELFIQNDAVPTVTSSPSTDVLFDPNEMPILEIGMEGYRAIDRARFIILDENKQTVLDTGMLNIQAINGQLKLNLLDDYNITTKQLYTVCYEVSHERVQISKMQLIGQGDRTVEITKQNGVVDGVSAYINDQGEIRLKPDTIYNYGDVRKTITVDMDNNPIVFFNITHLVGNWSCKIIPQGSVGDIALTPDNAQTGVVAYDLRSILSETGTIDITFVFFVIGGSAGDQNAVLKMGPITFGNSITLVAEKTDQVVSEITFDIGEVDLANNNFLHINVTDLSYGAKWKVFIVDNVTGRAVEMRSNPERKFNQKYNRNKLGHYCFDISEITGYQGVMDLSIKVSLIGNSATASIADVYVSNSDSLSN